MGERSKTSRARGQKKQPVPPWLTGAGYVWDTNKSMTPWIKLDRTLLKDPRFTALSYSSRLVYLAMMADAGKKADEGFMFTCTVAEDYGIPLATFKKAVKELEEAGFISGRRGNIIDGWTSADYAPNIYKATYTDWKNRKPETKGKKVRSRSKS